MRMRPIVSLAVVVTLAVAACTGDDAELSTETTIITEPVETVPGEGTTTTTTPGGDDPSVTTTLVGQAVAGYDVVNRIPNDNGVEQHIVIPHGAYTDVDLENFIIDLLREDAELFGAEVFDDAAAAEAFLIDEAERSEEETELLDRHWFATLTGRERIDFRGPFSEFPGGVIGS
jgi:hypothetical protein